VEGSVSWFALGLVLNLAINSVTLLLTLAQNLRLTNYLSAEEWRNAQLRSLFQEGQK
jgi:hypothetical protein